MKIANKKLFNDFLFFSQLQLLTWDIDPSYPLLKKVYKHYDYNKEIALWHTIVYVAFYHIGSAERFLLTYPCMYDDIKWETALPTGVERRGFRGRPDRVEEHLKDITGVITPYHIDGWIKQFIEEGRPYTSWDRIRKAYSKFRYAGNWSSYKFADLLKWVHNYDITASDFGVGGGGEHAGPIPGMVKLTGYDWKTCATGTDLQMEFYEHCQSNGANLFFGMDQCETCLCDFNSMMNGRYYVGHDIDQQLEFLNAQKTKVYSVDVYRQARKSSFMVATLGELNNWMGVRKKLKTLYKDTGKIYDPIHGG